MKFLSPFYFYFLLLITVVVAKKIKVKKSKDHKSKFKKASHFILQSKFAKKDMISAEPTKKLLEKHFKYLKGSSLTEDNDVVLSRSDTNKIKVSLPSFKEEAPVLESEELDDIVNSTVDQIVGEISPSEEDSINNNKKRLNETNSNIEKTEVDMMKSKNDSISSKEGKSNFDIQNNNYMHNKTKASKKLKGKDSIKHKKKKQYSHPKTLLLSNTYVDIPISKVRTDNFTFLDNSIEHEIKGDFSKTQEKLNLVPFVSNFSNLEDTTPEEINRNSSLHNRSQHTNIIVLKEVIPKRKLNYSYNSSDYGGTDEISKTLNFILDPFSSIDVDSSKKTIKKSNIHKLIKLRTKSHTHKPMSKIRGKSISSRDKIAHYRKTKRRIKSKTGIKKQVVMRNSKFEAQENQELSNLLTHLYNRDLDFAKNNVIQIQPKSLGDSNIEEHKSEPKPESDVEKIESESRVDNTVEKPSSPRIKLLEAKDVIETEDKSFDEVRLDEPNLHLLANVDSTETRDKIVSELTDVVKVLKQMNPPYRDNETSETRAKDQLLGPTKKKPDTMKKDPISCCTIKMGGETYKLEKVANMDSKTQPSKIEEKESVQSNDDSSKNEEKVNSNDITLPNGKDSDENEKNRQKTENQSINMKAERISIEEQLNQQAAREKQLKQKLMEVQKEQEELEKKQSENQKQKQMEEGLHGKFHGKLQQEYQESDNLRLSKQNEQSDSQQQIQEQLQQSRDQDNQDNSNEAQKQSHHRNKERQQEKAQQHNQQNYEDKEESVEKLQQQKHHQHSRNENQLEPHDDQNLFIPDEEKSESELSTTTLVPTKSTKLPTTPTASPTTETTASENKTIVINHKTSFYNINPLNSGNDESENTINTIDETSVGHQTSISPDGKISHDVLLEHDTGNGQEMNPTIEAHDETMDHDVIIGHSENGNNAKPFYIRHNKKVYKVEEVAQPCDITDVICKLQANTGNLKGIQTAKNNGVKMNRLPIIKKLVDNKPEQLDSIPIISTGEEVSDKKSENVNGFEGNVKDVFILDAPDSSNNEVIYDDEETGTRVKEANINDNSMTKMQTSKEGFDENFMKNIKNNDISKSNEQTLVNELNQPIIP